MDALDLFPDAGIRFIPVAHEQAACHAADGLARVTGRPQTCIAQNGPGAANFVSAMVAAYWAHSPVVALAPETGTMGIGTGGFQELDQMAMFEEQTVYQVRVNRPERMAELARRCFYMAKSESGPTHLNIPRDYFYGICEDEIYPTMDISRGVGSKKALEEAAHLLSNAKYPVILSGGGVSQGNAIEEVKALAEYLTAPVVNSYLHNDYVSCRSSTGHRSHWVLRFKGSHAHNCQGGCCAGHRFQTGAIWNASSVRYQLLAGNRQNHPG